MQAEPTLLDLIIIGAGPIGLACAIEASAQGLDYLVLEKGCLTNSIYHYPLNMTFFSTSEKLEIGGVPFVSSNRRPTRTEALEYYRRVADSKQLKVNLFEAVRQCKKQEDGLFHIVTSKTTYRAKTLILSTGFYDIPALMNIPGEDLPKVFHYYKDPHWFAYQKVAVIGSQNSAIDAALECYRKGAEVTLIIRNAAIGERVKYWVKPDMENRIKEGSIKALFNTCLTRIDEETITVRNGEREETLDNDFVLALTGYKPNYALLNMLGVELSDNEAQCPLYDGETMETNVEGLYLAGVVCGGMDTHSWFIENSREHAVKIAAHIASRIRQEDPAMAD